MTTTGTAAHITSTDTDTYRAACTCGFRGHWDDDKHVADLDADGHAWCEHGVKQGSLAPRTSIEVRCDNCGRKVSDKQADKYAAAVDWALCGRCQA